MKFIQIGDQTINLDLVTDTYVDGLGAITFYFSAGQPTFIERDTPGYASLKAYLQSLCVARFDAESDAALEVVQPEPVKVGTMVRMNGGVFKDEIGIVTRINDDNDAWHIAIHQHECRVEDRELFDVIPDEGKPNHEND